MRYEENLYKKMTLKAYLADPTLCYWLDYSYKQNVPEEKLNLVIVSKSEFKMLLNAHIGLLAIFKELMHRKPLRWERIDSETERVLIGELIEDKIEMDFNDYGDDVLIIPDLPEFGIDAQVIELVQEDDYSVSCSFESKIVNEAIEEIKKTPIGLLQNMYTLAKYDIIEAIYEEGEEHYVHAAENLHNIVSSFVRKILKPRIKEILNIKEITEFERLLDFAEEDVRNFYRVKLDPGLDPLENMWNDSIRKMLGED